MAKKTKDADYNQKVTIQLFKDNDKYKDDVHVCLNGKNYIIQRGIPVEVPLAVKMVLDNSAAQSESARKFMASVING